MGTKDNPGKFDCYAAALPDEPMFVLLARDPQFYDLVNQWARRRSESVMCGERPQADMALALEAWKCASEGQKWRKNNNGIWRVVRVGKEFSDWPSIELRDLRNQLERQCQTDTDEYKAITAELEKRA